VVPEPARWAADSRRAGVDGALAPRTCAAGGARWQRFNRRCLLGREPECLARQPDLIPISKHSDADRYRCAIQAQRRRVGQDHPVVRWMGPSSNRRDSVEPVRIAGQRPGRPFIPGADLPEVRHPSMLGGDQSMIPMGIVITNASRKLQRNVRHELRAAVTRSHVNGRRHWCVVRRSSDSEIKGKRLLSDRPAAYEGSNSSSARSNLRCPFVATSTPRLTEKLGLGK
jgi:hypothetical protein